MLGALLNSLMCDIRYTQFFYFSNIYAWEILYGGHYGYTILSAPVCEQRFMLYSQIHKNLHKRHGNFGVGVLYIVKPPSNQLTTQNSIEIGSMLPRFYERL